MIPFTTRRKLKDRKQVSLYGIGLELRKAMKYLRISLNTQALPGGSERLSRNMQINGTKYKEWQQRQQGPWKPC